MSLRKDEKERKRKRWIEVLWGLLVLVGVRANAIKSRYRSEIEEEIDRKRRLERNKSDLEREHDMAE